MPNVRAISEVEVENFLSLKKVSVPLDDLTVLVGPNGGGKSNFLSIFRFLGEVSRTDLMPAVESLFGSYENMFFHGKTNTKSIKISIKALVTENSSANAPDEYSLSFRPLAIIDRVVFFRNELIRFKRFQGRGRRITLKGNRVEFATERYEASRRQSHAKSESRTTAHGPPINIEQSSSALSVLRRIGNTQDQKQIGQLADIFEGLRLFDPVVGLARRPSAKDKGTTLDANASNLAAVLLRFKTDSADIIAALEDDVRQILPGFKRFKFVDQGGSGDAVRIELVERGLSEPTPLERASFGTVRAIALFAMLREPNPPRLTCIEEVDHGLHPYALDILVERLRDAATRSQIVIATHSPALVNRLNPSELRVLERDWDTGETRYANIQADTLERMRAETGFELGELWFSGALGGTP